MFVSESCWTAVAEQNNKHILAAVSVFTLKGGPRGVAIREEDYKHGTAPPPKKSKRDRKNNLITATFFLTNCILAPGRFLGCFDFDMLVLVRCWFQPCPLSKVWEQQTTVNANDWSSTYHWNTFGFEIGWKISTSSRLFCLANKIERGRFGCFVATGHASKPGHRGAFKLMPHCSCSHVFFSHHVAEVSGKECSRCSTLDSACGREGW